MTEILKGKPAADEMMTQVRERIQRLQDRGILPTAAIVRFGENPDDIAYERSIIRKAEEVGARVRSCVLPPQIGQNEAEELLEALSADSDIHGILILKPLPESIDAKRFLSKLVPEKDIDGASDASMAALYSGDRDCFLPCTAKACMELLRFYQIDPRGKRAVVLGRSPVIGRPAALLLLGADATVTVCHSKTEDVPAICREADILVACLGSAEKVERSYMNENQVILDVGINFNSDGKMVGDVCYEDAVGYVRAVTPVPGGVGAVTTAVLLTQLAAASERAGQRS